MSATDSTKPFQAPQGFLPQPCQGKKLLTAKETRNALRCSSWTLRRYLDAGRLKCVRVNKRRFLYETESVVALLAGHGRPS